MVFLKLQTQDPQIVNQTHQNVQVHHLGELDSQMEKYIYNNIHPSPQHFLDQVFFALKQIIVSCYSCLQNS